MKNDNRKKTKLDKRIYSLVLIAFLFGVIISIASSYALAETLIKSADVSYVDNSKLGATNVQAAIDGTCTKFSNDLQSFLLKVYPVGSIYISYNNTNPGTLFGGTWENYGNGRVLKGINSGTAGTTGGSETVTLSMSNIPAHTHDISHTHTTKASSITDVSVSRASLTGSILFHGYTDYSNVASVSGIFSEGIKNTNSYVDVPRTVTKSVGRVDLDASHSHTVTGTVPSLTTNSISTSTSGSAGSSNPTAINVQDPYITVYMWRRTK